MNHTLSTELYWLVLTILMTAIFWMPIILNRIFETGVWATLRPPQLQPNAQWAERMRRAHANAVENLVLFAPLVLAIQITGMSNTSTALACMVYFYARLVHVLAYILAVPLIRTLAFTAGFFSQMYLAATLLRAI
ncbi:MAG: MAPEG family protein [Methylotenera sp.]|uniref:MAPEG family protein n=1 Tax=Methylotenera sp. TaxID=2051956 RepID=UPI0017E6CC63|nr:MAPEG family protein [Methylotenera sp.]NOU24397.1 MAPEG family protein [Methylotenera sp.]